MPKATGLSELATDLGAASLIRAACLGPGKDNGFGESEKNQKFQIEH